MNSLKDFLYYNRKTVGIVVLLIILYFLSTIIVKEEKLEEVKEVLPQYFMVDIKGEIEKPGVYKVLEEKRIIDVIELSGGLLSDADITSINLSEKIHDEMIIYIPKKEIEIIKENDSKEEVVQKKDNSVSTKISINTGTKNDLMKVKGIGEVKAKSIIDYRMKNGRFKKVEDLMKVKGIGQSTFDKIKDYIKL